MKKKYLLTVALAVIFLIFPNLSQAQSTVTATYSSGDIPTSYSAYDSTCNGPSTTLSITLPAGTSWDVTGIDVQYDMTAASGAWMSEQRSLIYFQNASVGETTPTSGVGNSGGTFNYNRTNLSFANGSYPGGTVLTFEMQAWRTWGGTLCNTTYNKVDGNTWTITVHYQASPTCLPPSSIAFSNTTQTSVDVSWTQLGTPVSWNLEYGPAGFAQGSGTTVVVPSMPYTLSGLTATTQYDMYMQADCGGGDLSAWTTTAESFWTTADCSTSTLAINSTTGDVVPCIGTATLTAVGSGTANAQIYWYNAAVGGNLVHVGPTYQTPVLTTNTSYWVSEVLTQSGSGSGTLPTGYCVPSYGSGCTFGDQIDDFTLTDSNGVKIIEHLGSACSPSYYGDFTGDANLTGTLYPGDTYNFTATENFGGQHLKIWIDFNQNGSFADAGELLFTSSGGSTGGQTTGAITVPSTVSNGPTVMRVMDAWLGAPTDACTPGGSFGEAHDYKVTIGSIVILCETPRVQVDATISTAGDITVTTPLPYTDTNDSANYGDPYEGAPGSACGTTENYLNGNNVVYHFTAATTELVNILMSNLSGFYGGVFVYGSCADIGTTCLAGAVAGPSTADFGITDFPVTAGEDYYIVVTSWLTPTIGYTLDIVPFNCANLEAPDGAATQDFPTGDTVADLEADPTRTGATLTWYAESTDIPGSPIPTTTPLVNGEDYCVTQTFNGCESQPLCITVNEIDCTTLAITATTGDSVSCKGSLTLTATSSGTGSDIYWYNVATGGTPKGFGPQFDTPVLTTTTSYWAAEVFTEGGSLTGQGMPSPTGTSSTTLDNYGLEFDVAQGFTLISVDVYPDSGGNVTVELQDSSGAVLQTASATVAAPGPVTIPLNFFIPVGTDYRLIKQGSVDLIRDFSGVNFPYPLGPSSVNGEITSGRSPFGTSTSYYFFYNWTISTASVICESPRVQVDATVNQTGDVVIDEPAQVNPTYVTTDNTATYGNDFSGDPGTGCDGAGVLDGDDVVYQYVADPTNDNIIDIELSGISNPNTGMYIYATCGDVGTNCIAGGTNENSLTINIDDYYVTAGTTFFIVVSSASSSTNYTLTINGIDCANVAAPTIADPTPYFVAGNMLSDLSVDQNPYSTGLTWYADAAMTIVIDPATTPIVDGTTYYVTQTILGCESVPLAITPEEFQCGNMKITAATSDFYICAPGGNVTLTAQGSGLGTNVYWYDAATGGNIINVGNTFDVNVTSTTSFWAAETYGSSNVIGVGYCVPTFSSGCGFGDDIDDFILSIPGGATLINHLGSGCSPNEYGDFTGDPTLTATLQAGSTYDFTATSNYPSEHIKIWIDFNKNGSFADVGELLYTSSTSANTFAGTISIPAGASGTTAMRVRSADFSPPTDACSPDSFGEVHDYKVTIGSTGFFCESARTEITVTVNDQPTAAPTGNASQKFCEGATLADVVVTGSNIQWYDAATGGGLVSSNTPLTDGAIYYASQTVNACESGPRLEVTVFVDPIAAAPVGNINQSFYDGETIADLDVQGTNLTWFEEDGTPIADPTTFPLENYETYCVAQTLPDTCESELLCITVHELLGADDPLFEGLSYYPNPIRNKLFISNPAPMESVALYDLRGRKVLQQKVDGNKVALDVSGLQSGTYMLWVTIDGQTGAFKLIKE